MRKTKKALFSMATFLVQKKRSEQMVVSLLRIQGSFWCTRAVHQDLDVLRAVAEAPVLAEVVFHNLGLGVSLHQSLMLIKMILKCKLWVISDQILKGASTKDFNPNVISVS